MPKKYNATFESKSMNNYLSKWLRISFLNLVIVAFLGFFLRYKIAFYLPIIHQKFLLHSHSHFAFTGWISQSLMVLLIYFLSQNIGEYVYAKYRFILIANLTCSYGMLVSFLFQGYGLFSISFSTISILVFAIFSIYFWKDLNKIKTKNTAILWFKASLLFGLISSLGAFGLSYLMINKVNDQNLYLAAVYFFLHFQYNGWFLFAGMGLLADKLYFLEHERQKLKSIFFLFFIACIPAYFLSILWVSFSASIYILLICAVIAQVIGWGFMIKILIKNKVQISNQLSQSGKILLILSGIAFSIKLLLQTASIHPALSQISYGFRPIIIGYLHLVLLGVTTIFILGYIISFKLININKILIRGVLLFVIGIIINELLLMVQGVSAMSYIIVPYINEMLFTVAIIMLIGTFIIFTSTLARNIKSIIPNKSKS